MGAELHERFLNPSLNALTTLLATPPASDFTIQFSESSTYDVDSLSVVNRICEEVGKSATLRFFDHRRGQFDCTMLLQLPACRSLRLDIDVPLANINFLAAMQSLDALSLSVTEASVGEVLRYPNVQSVGKLSIGGYRSADCDFALLRSFPSLHTLIMWGLHRNIEMVGGLDSIETLKLAGMPRKVSLAFISRMKGLRRLVLTFGGRDNLDDVAHHGLIDLEIMRVRGLAAINCAVFPAMQTLRIDDQARLSSLDLRLNTRSQCIVIRNCKSLRQVSVDHLAQLEHLYLAETAVDPGAFMAADLPDGLKTVALWGYGKKRDAEIAAQLKSRGYQSAWPIPLHWLSPG